MESINPRPQNMSREVKKSVPSHIQRTWKRARVEFNLLKDQTSKKMVVHVFLEATAEKWNLEQLDLSQFWLKPAGKILYVDIFRDTILRTIVYSESTEVRGEIFQGLKLKKKEFTFLEIEFGNLAFLKPQIFS